jgi:hypothetical protein
MSANYRKILEYMQWCLNMGRKYQHTDPDKSFAEIEKINILRDVLKSLTNFESKLVSELDVD